MQTTQTKRAKRVLYNDIYGNTYCTNAISINGRVVKMSKIVSLYLCYYAFSMLVRYHPEKWKAFCESSDIAIIRKLLINCRREMLVEVIQLLSGKEYSFTNSYGGNWRRTWCKWSLQIGKGRGVERIQKEQEEIQLSFRKTHKKNCLACSWLKIHTKAFHVYFYLNVYHATALWHLCHIKNRTQCTLIHKNVYHNLWNVYHTPIFIKFPIYLWLFPCYIIS